MHRLFIDINVILDVALARLPHFSASQKMLSYVEKGKASGHISALSCAIVYYLVQKETNHKKAVAYIRDILRLFTVVEVNKRVLIRAFEIELADFEDSIQIACAENCEADYIITRNFDDFKKSGSVFISPTEYLATFDI
ncbi:MAG: PIN domain-containing protein [Candidatus Omnitrophota bacterium]